MKLTCEKLLLQKAISIASRATVSKSPIQLLEGLLLEATSEGLKITGYDTKIGIVTIAEAEVEKPGGIVLNARLFGEIIRKLPGQYVDISVESGYIAEIISEESKFEILGSQTSDYPEIPSFKETDSFNINEKTLKEMISQTNFAVSDNESRPIHRGVLFEAEEGNLTMVAVDGYRLALRREKLEESDNIDQRFVVLGASLNEVEKILADDEENTKISIDDKHIMFSIKETIIISRRLEGDFLDYKSTFPKKQEEKIKITAEKHDLIAAIERVSIIINEKMKSPVRCIFDDGVVKLSTASSHGKVNDICAITGNGKGLEIGFNDKYILEVLKAAPADDVLLEIIDGTSPCLVTPADDKENFIYMVLPIRLREG